MRRLLPLLLVLAACGGEPPAEIPEAREPIAFRYVVADEAPIHEARDAESAVLSTYKSGERVSILAEQDGWSEIRITFDTSGWARSELLGNEPPGIAASSGGGSASPRFRTPPAPVFSPTGVKGEIVLEATVNTEGQVANVRTLLNTTGRSDLEAKNAEELRRSSFYPLVVGGTRKPFIYEHRITY
jgi:hypothetical protein